MNKRVSCEAGSESRGRWKPIEGKLEKITWEWTLRKICSEVRVRPIKRQRVAIFRHEGGTTG